jgi:hypothetical protein
MAFDVAMFFPACLFPFVSLVFWWDAQVLVFARCVQCFLCIQEAVYSGTGQGVVLWSMDL